MPLELPKLDYPYDALEPYIDARTMEIHHGKHHAGYVAKTNAALEGYPDLQEKPLETLLADLNQVPEAIRTAVCNNGGGVANHSLFWKIMAPDAGGAPQGALADAIQAAFGGFDSFRESFSSAAGGVSHRSWRGSFRRPRPPAGS